MRHSGYLVGCCGAVFAVASFLIGLEVSSTTTTAAPSVDQAVSSVNRTLKGDRLPLLPGTSRNAVNQPFQIKAPQAPASLPELLDGCEPVISSIGQTPLAKIAGRCVS
jgi:hypothetical protein